MSFFMGLGRDASATARQLVGELKNAFPPELEAAAGNWGSALQSDAVTGLTWSSAGARNRGRALRRKGVDALLEGVREYRQRAEPGILGRLVFSRAFQRHLAAEGYSAEFIRQLTMAAIAELTRGIA